MPYYAQIDNDGKCFAVTQTKDKIDKSDMIEITKLEHSLLGKKRVGETWEEIAKIVVPPQPTRMDALFEKIAELAEKIGTIQMDVATIKNDTGAIKGNMNPAKPE